MNVNILTYSLKSLGFIVGPVEKKYMKMDGMLVMTSDDKTILTSAGVVITLMFGVLILG